MCIPIYVYLCGYVSIPRAFEDPEIRSSSFYQEALLHLLLLETSCFRYWGQGSWTSYAQEIYNRGEAVMNSFKSKKDMGD